MAGASAPDFSYKPDFDYHDEQRAEIITGEAVALDLRPTSFVLAMAGGAIDWFVYFVGGLLVLAFAAFPAAATVFGNDGAAITAALTASLVILFLVVPIAVETLSKGKSLGRLVVGARIVRDDGGAIGFRQAFIRGMASILEIYFTFGGLAVVVSLLNSRSKRLGDMLAGTYSQYERVSRAVPPVYGVPYELQHWALTADVARMPDSLGRRISQFLRQASALSPQSRDRLSRQLAAEASPWVSPLPNVPAEILLAGITAIRREREFAALTLERDRLDTLATALDTLPHGFPDRS